MKIVVASQDGELTGMVDPRFGRAGYYIVYDTDDSSWRVIDNTENTRMAHGAGIQSAQSVIEAGAEVVISGNFGPKASHVLEAAGVKIALWAEGTVAEAIELVRSNRLPAQA